jgi:cytoskeletal protein CcmA (bactofilin family)
MALITRVTGPNSKGSALTYIEMDNNLLYLDSKVSGSNGFIPVMSGSLSTTNSILYQIGNKIYATGSLDITGSISASYFFGDGSRLTNISINNPFPVITGSITAGVDVNQSKIFSIISGGNNFGKIDLTNTNTSFGSNTLSNNTVGNNNTSFGSSTLNSNISGSGNVAVGYAALNSNTNGNYNVAIGRNAGQSNVTGSSNVFLGHNAGANETNSDKLYIANSNTSTPLIKGDFSTGLLQFNAAAGTKITGSLEILSPNKSIFQINGSEEQFRFSGVNDVENYFQVALSGSIFNPTSQVSLATGDKNLSVKNVLKVLPTGVEITGSLLVSGSNTFKNVGPASFTGSVNINGDTIITGSILVSGSLSVNNQSVITSNLTSSLNVLSSSYAVSSSYALNSGLLNGSSSGQFAKLGPNTFTGAQEVIGNLTVNGNSNTLGSITVHSQSIFNAGIQVNGQNSTLYNGVGFLDLSGASGSKIDLHMRNGISSISTNVNNLDFSVPTGSATFQVIKGDFLINASGSILLASDVTASRNMKVSSSLLIGTSSFTPDANEKLIIDAGTSTSFNLITGRSNTNNYNQLNLQNINSGVSASTDIVATNDIGTETTHYVNMGINSSGFVNNGNGIGQANDAYLYTTGSNLYLANLTPNKNIYVSTVESGSLSISGSTQFTGSITHKGDLIVTGSSILSGSTTQIGNILLSGSIILSGSLTPSTPTIQIYGDTQFTGVTRFNPINRNIDTSISASYVYVSGSTNDLYFSQNGNGYNNTTRLRWLEGNLYTGLLHGGLIASSSSTVYTVQSGSGVIVSLNTSLTNDPFPTVKYVTWGTLSASIAPQTGSYDQTFVGIDNTSNIYAQGTPFFDGQYDTLIPIGLVLHQNRSTINNVKTQPSVAYGSKQRQSIFTQAFGPLKLSGFTLAPSGSSTGSLIVASGTSFRDGANYSIDSNNPSYVTDAGTSVSKIWRYRQSGSAWVYDTNNGTGYATIDPGQYSNNGTLSNVANNRWSIQRVFWFPNSVTKSIVVYYGNAIYTSQTDATANIVYETFVEAPNTATNAIYLGAIIARGDAIFTDTTTFNIQPGGLFRQVGGSGGGGSIVTALLSGLSDVSIAAPSNGQPLIYNSTAAKWVNQSSLTASLFGNASTSTSASYATFAQASTTSSYSDTLTINNGANITGSVNISGSIKISGSLQSLIDFNYQSGSTYTLQYSDLNKLIETNTVSGSTNYVVIPDNSSTPLPIGFECTIVQYGIGTTVISSGSIGVTINSENSFNTVGTRFGPVSVVKRGVNDWYLFGRLR